MGITRCAMTATRCGATRVGGAPGFGHDARMKATYLSTWAALAAALVLAACGGDDDGTTPVDAPVVIDAPAPMVMEVACASVTPTATVRPLATAFDPPVVNISTGQVVQFIMDSFHNSTSGDGLWVAGFNATVCVQFDSVGTFIHTCTVHGFTGQIVVQ